MTGPELNSSAGSGAETGSDAGAGVDAVAVAGPDTGAGAGAGDDDVSSAVVSAGAATPGVIDCRLDIDRGRRTVFTRLRYLEKPSGLSSRPS